MRFSLAHYRETQTETQIIQYLQDHTIACITANKHSDNYCLTPQTA